MIDVDMMQNSGNSFISTLNTGPAGRADMAANLGLTGNESHLTGGLGNSRELTDEDIETVLASIEAQKRSVMLARRLAIAREEQARGFPEDGIPPSVAPYRPSESVSLVPKNVDAVRDANTKKDEKELVVPKLPRYEELFRTYRNVRQGVGESVDSLIDRINALEAQIATQPEQPRIHTLLFALHLPLQEMILERQGHFVDRNELRTLAVELEAFEAKQQRRREQFSHQKSVSGSGMNKVSGRDGQTHHKGGSHAPSRISKGKGKGANVSSGRHGHGHDNRGSMAASRISKVKGKSSGADVNVVSARDGHNHNTGGSMAASRMSKVRGKSLGMNVNMVSARDGHNYNNEGSMGGSRMSNGKGKSWRRGGKVVSSRDGHNYNNGGSMGASRMSNGKGKSSSTGANGVSFRRSNEKSLSQIVCFHCQKPGHIASNCVEPNKELSGKARAQ